VISPSRLDLSILRAVLTEHAVDIESTSDVGAGVTLADASLAEYDFAVAVIPADHQRDASMSAIYVEIGVAVGRGLPLLVIAERSIPPLPALAGAGLAIVVILTCCVIVMAVKGAWFKWELARAYLALRRRIPWRLMTFLADAHRRGVLRQVGPVYQFR